MDLKNGYKVVYEVIETRGEDKVRVFKASKTGVFADAEVIAEAKIGEYKLIYEKDGNFYGSVSGLPTEADTCFEDFDKLFKDTAEEPTVNNTPAYAEAITANSDTYGDIIIDGSTVTINAVGEVKWLKSAWGTYGNWVGFRINVPEGVDATKAIYTRPNGKSSPLSEVLDTGKNYASVYSNMATYGNTATYYLDWTGDGMNDLTVTIDVSNATLASAPANEE